MTIAGFVAVPECERFSGVVQASPIVWAMARGEGLDMIDRITANQNPASRRSPSSACKRLLSGN
jgi:hypothetical protein